jgi:hypothetical protein
VTKIKIRELKAEATDRTEQKKSPTEGAGPSDPKDIN